MTLFTGEYIEAIVAAAETIDSPSAKAIFFATVAGVTRKDHLERLFHRNTLGKTCQYLVDREIVEYDKCTNLYTACTNFVQKHVKNCANRAKYNRI